MRSSVEVDPETGHVTFLCVRGRRMQPCIVCGQDGDRLCDGLAGPLEFGARPETCDASLCTACSTRGAGGTDLCPACVGARANRSVAP